ncbi:MAG: hypothetical protein IT560_09185 [Alphaproteobacteria bacterium]|jgi:hypothetical protein|nr:hypothetical protein [Alphaproteobacteria bacterium]
MEDAEIYEKLNDYTLSAVSDFGRQSGADPELRRIFNFKARQVTNIFSQWYSASVSNSMVIQKFSELDSLDEVADMHQKLRDLGGNPPPLEQDTLGKPARSVPLRP